MSAITIRIVTPKAIAFEGHSDMITGPSFDGQFGVLENHTQFLTLNEPGIITLGQDKSGPAFVVGKGFAEVANNIVTFLVDSCITTSDVNGSLDEYVASLSGDNT
jgi:F-type H+-transporting ATPase subunit epsilon